MESIPKGMAMSSQEPRRPGLYLKLFQGEWLWHRGGPLPESGRSCYLRMPLPLALVLGPVVGALYVLLLPFVGAMLAACVLAQRLARSLRGASMAFLSLWSPPNWLPGRSYLLRHWPHRKGGAFAESVEDELRKLARKIEEKGREKD